METEEIKIELDQPVISTLMKVAKDNDTDFEEFLKYTISACALKSHHFPYEFRRRLIDSLPSSFRGNSLSVEEEKNSRLRPILIYLIDDYFNSDWDAAEAAGLPQEAYLNRMEPDQRKILNEWIDNILRVKGISDEEILIRLNKKDGDNS